MIPDAPSTAKGYGALVETWNVAFTAKGSLGHVLAFGAVGAGLWIVVDPCRRKIAVRLLKGVEFDLWIRKLSAEAEVYRIAARAETSVFHPGLWCVGVVKRLVGLNSGALSPAGLKRDLLRAGALRVFQPCAPKPTRKTLPRRPRASPSRPGPTPPSPRTARTC